MLKVLWKFSKLNEGCQPQPSARRRGGWLPTLGPCAAPVTTGRGREWALLTGRQRGGAENWLERPELKLGDYCNNPGRGGVSSTRVDAVTRFGI